jgi:hypothetical protein
VGLPNLRDLTGDDIYRAQNLIRFIQLIEVVDLCMTDDGMTPFLFFPSSVAQRELFFLKFG